MTAPCPAFGFVVTMEPLAALGGGARDALLDAWIECLHSHGLYCGGAGGPERFEYVVWSEASQATENDREVVTVWLAARRDLRRWWVGALEDLNQAV